MTEYVQTSDGQIHADFARRAGQILLQYERLSRNLDPREQFDATLAVSLLQSLLTSFIELSRLKAMKPRYSQYLDVPIDASPPRLGLNPSAIRWSWRSAAGLRYRDVIESIRNSLSHPTPQDGSRPLPTTGFTARATSVGEIDGYCFVQSPWVEKGGRQLLKRFRPELRQVQECSKLREELTAWGRRHDVMLEADERDGILVPCLGGQPFVPFIEVILSTCELRVFVLALADIIGGEQAVGTVARTHEVL
ncbi:hypothetical protein [Inhella gelatinilytica]|uniref:Uncharacterized protein n=1 Tax=Inhella gelatinilytica TaxID=2795030 RepID=A0A931IW84_9BURK|nr:hypothetical protein [Inhella gelatinilytica]MBH9553990.1 hypothetical protein [Inhella gelatinilytica]